MVNESGASVYSASEAAGRELPELDVTVRGAVSIARRLQDPLSELVKIDPRSIGVGQYQHDVDEAKLKAALEEVVESAVNLVGVNVNLASEDLLKYVSGLNRKIAAGIVRHRDESGVFGSREELKERPRPGGEDLRAGRRIPADSRGTKSARRYGRPPGALRIRREDGCVSGRDGEAHDREFPAPRFHRQRTLCFGRGGPSDHRGHLPGAGETRPRPALGFQVARFSPRRSRRLPTSCPA